MKKLITCKECKTPMSKHAKSCPKCGAMQHHIGCIHVFGIFFFVGLFILIALSSSEKPLIKVKFQRITPTPQPVEKEERTQEERQIIWQELSQAWETITTFSNQNERDLAISDTRNTIMQKHRLTLIELQTIQQEGIEHDWSTIQPIPTPVSTTTPTPELHVNKTELKVSADRVIKEYVVKKHGYARKHVKIGSWKTSYSIIPFEDGSYTYSNILYYKNAYNADMETSFLASLEYKGDFKSVLLSIEFE